jgi:hypothetical protein
LLEQFPRIRGALLALAVAAPGLVFYRGFTVDDALVSARVAAQLAAGAGYRFNPEGPEVDAVTPLGWAHLLSLGGPGSPVVMLERARVIGTLGWLFAVATLGVLLSAAPAKGRRSALALLAVCVAPALWASSGMETGLVTLLAALGLAAGPPGALAAGIAAALRPELAPWAIVLSVGRVAAVYAEPKRRVEAMAVALALSLGPLIAVALLRYFWFGSPAPLSLSAKPPDLWPGVKYAAAATLLTGPPLALIAPLALTRSGSKAGVLVAALAAHTVSMALAGGDWMKHFRLEVPVLPTALLALAELTPHASRFFGAIRLGLALLVSLVAAVDALPSRHVLRDRLETIARLRPVLTGARMVATVDIGIVGAATPAAVLDLAGITDPTIARLPGGHTSKRVPEGLVESRGVDRAVLLLAPGTRAADPWQDSQFSHLVAARLAAMPLLSSFEPSAEVPIGRTAYRYLVLERRRPGTGPGGR